MRPPRAVLALVALVLLAGCLGFGGPPPSDPGAETVVDEAASHSADVETYRFAHDIAVTASDGEDTHRVTVDATGAVNRTAQRLRVNTTHEGTTRQTFVDGDTAYTECESPWGWGVENVSEDTADDWRTADPLGRQIDLMQSSPVYWAGNETIDGVAVHVVEARPSGETLTQYGERRQTGLFGPDIEDATFTAYVAEDSGRLLRTVFTFTVTGEGGSAEARMTTRFTDVGSRVDITIPVEARSADTKFGCPGS